MAPQTDPFGAGSAQAGNRLDPHLARYAERTRGMTASEIRSLFAVASRPEVVSLAGGIGQLRNQIIGIVVTAVLSGVATMVILKVVDAVIGLRVEPEEEAAGLDVSQHGEAAYNE